MEWHEMELTWNVYYTLITTIEIRRGQENATVTSSWQIVIPYYIFYFAIDIEHFEHFENGNLREYDKIHFMSFCETRMFSELLI